MATRNTPKTSASGAGRQSTNPGDALRTIRGNPPHVALRDVTGNSPANALRIVQPAPPAKPAASQGGPERTVTVTRVMTNNGTTTRTTRRVR